MKHFAINIPAKRVISIDVSRALCMLWIIGVWHMISYTGIDVANIYSSQLTIGVMGCFIFISGLMLGRTKLQSKEDVKRFYKRRFLRIWPLFFMACSLLLVVHYLADYDYIASFKQYILTILGIVCFFPPIPKTVWFASLIIFFYLITPVVYWKNDKKRTVLISACMLIILVLLYIFAGISNEIVLYLPFYIAGLLLSDSKTLRRKSIKVSLVVFILSLLLAIICSYLQGEINSFIFQYIVIAFWIVSIWCAGELIAYLKAIHKFCYFVSYGSFAAYLFHRLYFGVIVYFIHGFINPVLCYLFILPLFLVISYYIQFYYDNLFSKQVAIKLRK